MQSHIAGAYRLLPIYRLSIPFRISKGDDIISLKILAGLKLLFFFFSYCLIGFSNN